MKSNKILVLLVFLCSVANSYGQNRKLNFLWKEYKKATHDTTRIKLYLNIGDEYENTNPDTAIFYYQKALSLSEINFDKLETSNTNPQEQTRFKSLQAKSLRYIGVIYKDRGSYDKALEYYLDALKIFDELLADCADKKTERQIKLQISACYNSIGIVYYEQGDYNKALEYYLKVLEINEELGYKNVIAACYGNIGSIYGCQASYDKAIEYFLKSLRINEEMGNKIEMAKCYNDIGTFYTIKANADTAMKYYLRALKIFDELNDKYGVANCYDNIGSVYNLQGKYSNAIEYDLKALKFFEELGDKQGVSKVYQNLAEISLADSSNINAENKIHSLNKSIEYGLKSFELAREIKAVFYENEVSNTLMLAYKKLGDFKKSVEYAQIFITTKDKMFSEEKTKALAGMEAKYQNEKKQLEIDKLGKEKELQLSENKRQRVVIWFEVFGLVLVLVFAGYISRSLRITHKQKDIIEEQKGIVDEKNKILNQQNEEIVAQRDEIEAQRDEIEAQRDLVVQQKEHIEAQNKEITDSIVYAEQIQQALLPTGKYADSIIGEHFVLFKPKDIISGDFYWTTQINEWLIVTVADCTGHGVPGALMSMLGISFLNEIVRKKEITKASEILDHLRESVIESLQQKGLSGEQRDGMDMALIVINTSNSQLQYSGANNPLYIVNANKELKEIEPDKQPVAINIKMQPFTNHVMQLSKGDCIYLASDGYMDQFGGSNYKKFRISQLKELFLNIADKPMKEQKEILDTTFVNWKGTYEQTDDVTILGLRV